MDVERAIRTHRAIRRFRDAPIATPDLDAILHAGRRSGSSKNLQRWRFVVVSDRGALRRLAGAGPYAGHISGAAVAIALVTPDPGAPGAVHSIMWDLGRAAQNMMLAAWARAIGSAPATVYEEELAREVVGYPLDQHCEYILSFGYPADPEDLTRPPRAGGRRVLEEIVSRDRW